MKAINKIAVILLLTCLYFSGSGIASAVDEPAADNQKFIISSGVLRNSPALIVLILNTISMDDEERQYWFDILPAMNATQTARLFEILETERVKLEALEIKYQQDIRELNARYQNRNGQP